jgi:hypothetical protein
MATGLQATKSQLPVIDRPIDNTALSAYMACPREYALAMMLHRRAAGTSAALTFGAAWHKALEIHYKSDGNEDAVMLGTQLTWKDHDSPDDYRTLQRVLLDYKKYAKTWGKPSAEAAKTVGWPDAPLVELSTNAQGKYLMHPWAGKIDRIIELGGQYYIEDHKTTSRLDKNYFKQFELSYQMMGYTYLGRQLLPGKKIAGVRINLSHVLKTGTNFQRQLFTFSDRQIDEWVDVTNRWFKCLAGDVELYLELVEKGYESLDALCAAFPAHFGDNGCSRKFGLCQYLDVCSAPPQVRMRMLEQNFEFRPWNPLEVEDE